jgi:hypothetical protein
MQTPLNFKDIDQPVTLYDYYTEYNKPSVVNYVLKYTIGLPGIILKAIKGKPGEIGNSVKLSVFCIFYQTNKSIFSNYY